MRLRQGIFGVAVAAVLLAVLPSVALARDLGFKIQANGKGFKYNPVLTTVRVTEIKPNSEAAVAGFQKGDQIVEFNGTVVPGSRMLMLGAKMKAVGEKDPMKFVVLREGKRIPLTMVPLKK